MTDPHPAQRTDVVDIGGVLLGSGQPTRLITSFFAAREGDLPQELRSAAALPVDLLEWRIDSLEGVSPQSALSAALLLRAEAGKPLIGTLRTAAEGGRAEISDRDYGRLTQALASSGALDALDLEFRRRSATEVLAAAHASSLPVILSHHDTRGTPSAARLRALFQRMADAGGDILKIAVTPQGPEDVLTLLSAALSARKKLGRPLIAVAMGPLGRVSRISGGLFGSDATFVRGRQSSAPGQLAPERTRALIDFLTGRD